MNTTTEEPKLEGEKIHKYGLKIKLFVLNCRHENRSLGPSIASEFKSNNLDYCDSDPGDVFDNILNAKFLQYSTLIIIRNGYCLCYIRVLEALLHCIRENKCLRYKSKLIILNNVENCRCKRDRRWLLLGPPEETELNCGKYDNVIIFQNNVQFDLDTSQCFLIMLLIADSSPLVSIQEVLQPAQRPAKHEVIRTSTTADLYLYTINPALAIIINNYYFTTPPHQIREGSEQDVINLIRELKIAHVPYILIEDCDREQLMEILNYIERKDFQPLKSFLFFLMSHGGDDNVVYTHDGEVNAKHDIVEKIQANKSLKDAETLIVLNSCRGSIDMDYADYSDLQRIQSLQSPDISHLKANTMVLYSVPRGVQSPRDKKKGCPLIMSFCQQFSNIDHTDDIRLVTEKIDRDLQKWTYYEELDRPSEFLINDLEKSKHNIVKFPTNAVTMIQLIDSILEDFPTSKLAKQGHNEEDIPSDSTLSTLFYICGTLNDHKFPKISIVQKYFADDLDKD